MEKEKGHYYGQLAQALQQNLAAIRGGGGGEDGDSDDDDWDISDEDWSESEEEMGFGLFDAADEVSDAIIKPLELRYTARAAAIQLADAKKPAITVNELNIIFSSQKEVRCL